MIDTTRLEKIAMLAIVGGIVVAITVFGMATNDNTIRGMVVTGMIAFAKDIIAAIRGYSMSAQLGKVTDQLAKAGPVQDEEK